MPREILYYPPARIDVRSAPTTILGIRFDLNVQQRQAIAAIVSTRLLQEWARVARATAPRRSGRLAATLRPVPGRGLQVGFYGPFQQQGQRLPWLEEAWLVAVSALPAAARLAITETDAGYDLSDLRGSFQEAINLLRQFGDQYQDLIDQYQDLIDHPLGGYVVEGIQRRAPYYVIALVAVRLRLV